MASDPLTQWMGALYSKTCLESLQCSVSTLLWFHHMGSSINLPNSRSLCDHKNLSPIDRRWLWNHLRLGQVDNMYDESLRHSVHTSPRTDSKWELFEAEMTGDANRGSLSNLPAGPYLTAKGSPKKPWAPWKERNSWSEPTKPPQKLCSSP